VALVSAVWGWQIARDTDRRSIEEFEENRAIVLRIESIDPNQTEVTLAPLDGSVQLYVVTPTYPFPYTPVGFDTPSRSFRIPANELRTYIDAHVPRQQDAIMWGDVNVPVVLRSDYVSRSKRRVDVSLYAIQVSYGVFPTERPTDIQLRSLLFIGKLNPAEDPQSRLSKEAAAVRWRSFSLEWATGRR
jgi:hypothetical protein